jgi:hypothetical protein
MATKSRKKIEFARSGRSKYPWNQWLDGGTWELDMKTDITVPLTSFRALVSSTGKRNGMQVSTQLSEDKKVLYLQASPLVTPAEKKPNTKKTVKKTVVKKSVKK